MKLRAIVSILCLALPAAVLAGANFSESLKAADAAIGTQQGDVALREIDAALTQAANPGERALALSKKGYVLAFLRKDYAAARQAVDEALQTPMAPVARVTALQTLAECQMKANRDFQGAISNLETAMALPDVDWAKPSLGMSLADAHREVLQLNDAMTAYQRVTEMANAPASLRAGAWLNIGYIYQYDRKDAAGARNAYAKAVELKPDLRSEVDKHQASLAP